METTAEILSAWADLASGKAAELPLSVDLYPLPNVEAAVAAFAGLCRVAVVTRTPCITRIMLQAEPACGHASLVVIGSFLNYLLQSPSTKTALSARNA